MTDAGGKPEKYTAKMKRFVQEYLIDFNGTQAAIRAGYSPKSARQSAAVNMKKAVVQAAIREAMVANRPQYEMLRDRVVEEMIALATANASDFFEWSEDGGVTLVDSDQLTRQQKAAVQSISQKTVKRLLENGEEVETTTLSIKLYDKQKSLDMLGKHTGAYVERVELSGPDGTPLAYEIDWGDGSDAEEAETESSDS